MSKSNLLFDKTQETKFCEIISVAKKSVADIAIPNELAEAIVREAATRGFSNAGIVNQFGEVVLIDFDSNHWYFDCSNPIAAGEIEKKYKRRKEV
jgi:hypothetical protein